jgi:hypothetical protein
LNSHGTNDKFKTCVFHPICHVLIIGYNEVSYISIVVLLLHQRQKNTCYFWLRIDRTFIIFLFNSVAYAVELRWKTKNDHACTWQSGISLGSLWCYRVGGFSQPWQAL